VFDLLPHCRAAGAALGLGLLAACATLPPPGAVSAVPATDEPFEVVARMSARHASEGIAVNVRWQHEGPRDELFLSTPMGGALARLTGDGARVRLELADGQVRDADDFESLTRTLLGVPLPVRGLAWWIRGQPRPGSPHAAELDGRGRVEVLRQDGWEIVYGYGDGPRPVRVTMRYPEVEVRIVVDQWGAPIAGQAQ